MGVQKRVLFYKHEEGRNKKKKINDALNTFFLQLYGIGRMVKDHSDSKRERGNSLLPQHGLLFSISTYYMHHPRHKTVHTTAIVTPVVDMKKDHSGDVISRTFGRSHFNLNEHRQICLNSMITQLFSLTTPVFLS